MTYFVRMRKPLWAIFLCGPIIFVLGAGDVSASKKFRDIVRFKNLDRFQIDDNGYKPGTIIVSFGNRKIFYVDRRGKVRIYPIAIPAKSSEWAGESRISSKRKNPGWGPTRSMRRENPNLPRYVRGGDPKNPLGERALYLGRTLYRIHGTNEPWLIGRAVSHGCIRMYNEDVKDLYERVKIGARVVVTWKKYDTLPVDAPGYREDDNKSSRIRLAETTVQVPELPVRGLRKGRESSGPASRQATQTSGANKKNNPAARRTRADRPLALASLAKTRKRRTVRRRYNQRQFGAPRTVGTRAKRHIKSHSKRKNHHRRKIAKRTTKDRRGLRSARTYSTKRAVAGWLMRLLPTGSDQ